MWSPCTGTGYRVTVAEGGFRKCCLCAVNWQRVVFSFLSLKEGSAHDITVVCPCLPVSACGAVDRLLWRLGYERFATGVKSYALLLKSLQPVLWLIVSEHDVRYFGLSWWSIIMWLFRLWWLLPTNRAENSVSGGCPSPSPPHFYRTDHSRFIQTSSSWSSSFSCCGIPSFNLFCVRKTFSCCIEINHHVFRL